MIVILAVLEVDDGSVESFVTAAELATLDSEADQGCVDYAFSRHLTQPATFHITEVWADEASFDAHVASAHHADFKQRLSACNVVSRTIDRYDASSATKLS